MPVIIDYEVYLSRKEIVDCGIANSSFHYDLNENNLKVFKSDEHGKVIAFHSLQWNWRKKINEHYGGCVKRYTQLENIAGFLLPCPKPIEALTTTLSAF